MKCFLTDNDDNFYFCGVNRKYLPCTDGCPTERPERWGFTKKLGRLGLGSGGGHWTAGMLEAAQ